MAIPLKKKEWQIKAIPISRTTQRGLRKRKNWCTRTIHPICDATSSRNLKEEFIFFLHWQVLRRKHHIYRKNRKEGFATISLPGSWLRRVNQEVGRGKSCNVEKWDSDTCAFVQEVGKEAAHDRLMADHQHVLLPFQLHDDRLQALDQIFIGLKEEIWRGLSVGVYLD